VTIRRMKRKAYTKKRSKKVKSLYLVIMRMTP
jgi:hypothetical protein